MVGPSKQASIDTHVRNAVTLVWGSLRLTLKNRPRCYAKSHTGGGCISANTRPPQLASLACACLKLRVVKCKQGINISTKFSCYGEVNLVQRFQIHKEKEIDLQLMEHNQYPWG